MQAGFHEDCPFVFFKNREVLRCVKVTLFFKNTIEEDFYKTMTRENISYQIANDTITMNYTVIPNQAFVDLADSPIAFSIYFSMLRVRTLPSFYVTKKWLANQLGLSEERIRRNLILLRERGYVKQHKLQLASDKCYVFYEALVEPAMPEYSEFTYKFIDGAFHLSCINGVSLASPVIVTSFKDIVSVVNSLATAGTDEVAEQTSTPPATKQPSNPLPTTQKHTIRKAVHPVPTVTITTQVSSRPRMDAPHTPVPQQTSLEREVAATLCLQRRLTQSEREYLALWKATLSDELIVEACAIGIANKPQGVTFRYIDGIIANWRRCGVVTLADVKKQQDAWASSQKQTPSYRKNQFQQFHQREITAETLEFDELLMREVQLTAAARTANG